MGSICQSSNFRHFELSQIFLYWLLSSHCVTAAEDNLEIEEKKLQQLNNLRNDDVVVVVAVVVAAVVVVIVVFVFRCRKLLLPSNTQ